MSDPFENTNPFDDDDGDDGKSNNIDDYDPSLDPFADDIKLDNNNDKDSKLSAKNIVDNKINFNEMKFNNKKSSQHHKQRLSLADDNYYQNNYNNNNNDNISMDFDRHSLNNSNLIIDNHLDKTITQSRLSLQSNTSSSTMIEQQLQQYSLGDGDLQKEGLLCPDCMKEYRTITELMKHFDLEHNSNNNKNLNKINSKKFSIASSWSSKNLAPLSKKLFSNDSSLVGEQIKGFLDKIVSNVNNNKQSLSSNYNNVINSLQIDDSTISSYDNNNNNNNSDMWNNNPIKQWKYSMQISTKRSHYDYFRQIRDLRVERYVFETNKLMIRLDKLLKDYPPINDWIKRRKHEQSIVEWIDETIVPLCPSCANKFNIITRKKHHCRLCGAVMCTKCSQFITFKFAHELINPVNIDNNSLNLDNNNLNNGNHFTSPLKSLKPINDNKQQQLDETLSPLRTLMTNMLNSPLVSDQELIDKLRICYDCKTLLLIRKEKMDVQHNKPEIVKLYEQLYEQIQQINRLLPVLYRMSNSINMGESTYQLKDAKELKQKLSQLGEQSDLLSRKIEIYGLTPTEMNNNSDNNLQMIKISSKQISIQKSIRNFTCNYLRNNLLGLPELPDDEQFEQLKQKHNQLLEKRIRLEKEMVLMEQENFRKKQQQQHDSNNNNDNKINFILNNDDGFCPQQPNDQQQWQTNLFNEQERYKILIEQNPILQQINIIRLYIKQAKNDHRYEEIKLLEENLRELEIEYYFTQQQQQQDNNHFDDDDDDDEDIN